MYQEARVEDRPTPVKTRCAFGFHRSSGSEGRRERRFRFRIDRAKSHTMSRSFHALAPTLNTHAEPMHIPRFMRSLDDSFLSPCPLRYGT